MSEDVMRIKASREKTKQLNAWAKANGYRQQAAVDKAIESLLKSKSK